MHDYGVCLLLIGVSVNLSVLLGHVAGSNVLRIRGIPISKSSFYPPEKDFQCFDGSLLVPFSYVNDDYCDCADGSDEPGTPACGNAYFYCENFGHRSQYIPSTWVNDGVCDCCDGSDEYASSKECINNCNELGREARLEQQKAKELIREGSKIRAEMVSKGKRMRSDYLSRIVKLRADYEEAQLVKKEKEVLKNQAEERESSALEKYKPVEPEQLTPEEGDEEEELKETEAEDYFKLLDSDNSGTVTIAEIQTRSIFDKDRDGAISDEEAMYFLNNQKEINIQEFMDVAWRNIKPFLMLSQGLFKPAGQKEELGASENSEVAQEEDQEKEDEEGTEEEDTTTEEEEKTTEQPSVQYDEETQALINEATSARERFQEAEKAATDLQAEIRKLEEKLDRDYGSDEEFAPLDGECFEYTDLEYVYALCIFDKATQRAKSGGNDINLGHWREWVGPEEQKYSKMKYDRGLACWNGPERSTTVTLICGKENKLISVTEPSRCEYAMEFATPALCKLIAESADTHDEL